MTPHRPCPVCKFKEAKILGNLMYAVPEDSPIAKTFDVVMCVECGFVTSNTPSTQNDYDRFYVSSNYSLPYIERKPGIEEQKYYDESAIIIRNHMSNIGSTIFDIGCGLGFLLKSLQKLGVMNLYGVDPSTACVNFLNMHGLSAQCGTLSNIPFGDIDPEIITVFHIVEHLIDIESQIQDLHSRLATGGKVMVEVPDTEAITKYCDGKPLSFFYYTHVIHFDAIHLKNLFESNGFVEVERGKRMRDEKELKMPCVWSIFEKKDSFKVQYTPTFTLGNKIESWFKDTGLDPKGEILALAKSGIPVYIWGMGVHAHQMLGMSPLKDCNIKALVDQNKNLIGTFVGKWIIESSDLLAHASQEECVFITALIHKEKMRHYLKEQYNFSGKILTI